MHPLGPAPWTPPEAGWYTDPWNGDYRRWYDGQQWTPTVEKVRRGKSIFGPLLVVAGIATAVFFILAHPSVHVPLAGDTDCGGNSWTIGTASLSDFSNSVQSDVTDALDQECINKGRTNLYKAAGAVIVGLTAGGLVSAYERNRS
jgi:hypothetical protein